MVDKAGRADPMDGSTEEFSPGERARIRKATTWAEESKPILSPVVALVKNWKAWLIGLTALAVLRRPEVVAVLDVISGAGQ
jgi:hypothetical protein